MADRPQNKNLKPVKPGEVRNPNGRPKGSRNKLSEAFIQDYYEDWVENGAQVIVKVRQDNPVDYVKIAASLLPKELKIERSDELSDSELDQRIRQLAGIIGVEVGIAGVAGAEEATAKPKPARGVPTIQ